MVYDKLKNLIHNNDGPAQAFGIEVLELAEGYSKISMPLDGRQNNHRGVAHGGALFCMADIAGGLASPMIDDTYSVTLNSDISYLKPGINGPLTAIGRLVSSTYKVCVVEVEITDANGEKIVLAKITNYRKKMPY